VTKSALGMAALLVLGLLPALHAVEKRYEAARIAGVEQKSRERVLYYLVNTPVTENDPYYEVSVRLKDEIYVGEYTPRHVTDTLPEDWKADSSVEARVEKHYLFLRSPDRAEIKFVIVKRLAADVNHSDPHANK
jgi:hypothetical protein